MQKKGKYSQYSKKNSKTVRSILTEQRFLSHNDHPLITKLFHSFHSHERLFLVMEFCPGGELFTMIRKQPGYRLNEEQVKFYASEVISVLEYLHSKGYIYRGKILLLHF
jgi:serine/threonine protein kinase